ncbi:MAG: PilN domain-containing protein [Rhizobacter sp.]|nr:PilN domain-containing protein [Rhizobacter sp.]MBP6268911.1 PilN domain-containing protein [Rhizobacter sp.]
MILINLLPHREEKRRRKKIAFLVGIGASAIAGALTVGIWYGIVQQLTSTQQERNAYLGSEIKKLEEQIKDVASLKAEIESLKARQKAVEDLQTDRNVPVYLLNELVKQTPEGMYFSSVKQNGQTLSVLGIAQTNERVSEFLRNTANNSEWLEKPQLVEIKVSGAQAADRSQKRLFDFSIRVTVKRPQEKPIPAAAPAASAAVPRTAAVPAMAKG